MTYIKADQIFSTTRIDCQPRLLLLYYISTTMAVVGIDFGTLHSKVCVYPSPPEQCQ